MDKQKLLQLISFMARLGENYQVVFGEQCDRVLSTAIGGIPAQMLHDAVELNRQLKEVSNLTDDDIRKLWKTNGGDFFGPHIETGSMPEEKLLPLLRQMLVVPSTGD